MTMAACYTNYDTAPISHGVAEASAASSHHGKQHQQTQLQHQNHQHQLSQLSTVAAATALVTVTAAAAASSLAVAANNNLSTHKDYFIPLHVDCSVEYELPNQPKPPAGQRVEPLLMIHPCYFRKMESQRRSPFINNMPNSTRNSAALLVGVSPAQSSNTVLSSSSLALSSRRTSARHQQPQTLHQPHNHHQRQSSSTQYSLVNHHQTHQQAPVPLSQAHSQQAIYPVVSISSSILSSGNGQYIEHASSIRRSAASSATASAQRSHQQSRSATTVPHQQKTHQNHQQNLLVQNPSSSTSASHWDQLAAVATIVTSIAPPNNSVIPAVHHMATQNVCAIKSNSNANTAVGKRDAMLSDGFAAHSANTTSSRLQTARTSNSGNICPSKHNNQSGHNNMVSTSLVDTTNLRWTTAATMMTDRSPIATVPSNYQAGPDTSATPLRNALKTNMDNGNSKNHLNINGKYRQYLRSHRLSISHPYLATTSSSTPAPTPSANIGQAFPQFSTAAVAVAVTPSFQQHLQQISCYNV